MLQSTRAGERGRQTAALEKDPKTMTPRGVYVETVDACIAVHARVRYTLAGRRRK